MHCVNCGAEVTGSVCEYCGTHYGDDNGKVSATFNSADHVGVLKVGNTTFPVYIGDVEVETLYANVGRDVSGRMMKPVTKRKHRFTLIEL